MDLLRIWNSKRRDGEYDVWASGFREGMDQANKLWLDRMKDRQFLEDELQSLDYSDELREQDIMRSGG